ncbi:MAG: hypothetical protein ACOCV9_01875 [Marinilabiliaceae bacterium]
MRRGKHIGLFFLGMAGLIIFAHEVIPHHHHTHSAYIHNYSVGHDACDHSENDSSPYDDSSTHCHAFNDITVERQTFIKISQPELSIDSDLFLPVDLTSGFEDAEESPAQVYLPDFWGPDLLLFSVAPHRGPPVA